MLDSVFSRGRSCSAICRQAGIGEGTTHRAFSRLSIEHNETGLDDAP